MCGIFGISSKDNRDDIGAIVAAALNQMQNRGDYSAGIAAIKKLGLSRRDYRRLRPLAVGHTLDDFDPLEIVKGLGKIADIFKENMAELDKLIGFMAIGQVRYPTAGYTLKNQADMTQQEINDMVKGSIQPIVAPYHKVAMVHNGDVHNFREIMDYFEAKGLRQATNNDLEAILKVFNEEFFSCSDMMQPAERVAKSVKKVFDRVKGTYNVLTTMSNVGLIAFRDPNGRRPLFFGVNKDEKGEIIDYAFASETVALEKMLFKGTLEDKYVSGKNAYDEVKPGEMIFISKDFEFFREQIEKSNLKFCPFEGAYFSRASSFLNNKRVKAIRKDILNSMWKRFQNEKPEIYKRLIDNGSNVIICPVPRTAESAAQYLVAECSKYGFVYDAAIEKNPSAPRIFMQPTQKHRDLQTIEEHYIFEEDVKDKIVILVDDSIVRGTTIMNDVKYLRDVGAKEIHIFITFPSIRNPCHHAINFHTTKELFAQNKKIEQLENELGLNGVGSLNYAIPEDLSRATGYSLENLCNDCYVS
ncbi:MAG: hypothetical protein KKF46_08600 [Nanoarchaeota archaeon]|nr:hypothetical protein [Nanoarchaeota archaeon]MBU1322389.1 hypothetical protein [Nanoarchaeota archaeon]MBU1596936.1 hypothetical protein [Nanoarchaeota archaeon]MBU2442347.1 hypothetical protein [Nanoarchaeota archaeon]